MRVAICDLCLSDAVHETVNLGFLYGVSLLNERAEPRSPGEIARGDRSVFYADPGHLHILRGEIERKRLPITDIEYIPLRANLSSSPLGYWRTSRRCRFILDDMVERHLEVLLILSSVAFQRQILKQLLSQSPYLHLKCVCVMHGDLEQLSPMSSTIMPIDPSLKTAHNSSMGRGSIPILRRLIRSFNSRLRSFKRGVRQRLEIKVELSENLFRDHSPRVRYLVLADHILTHIQDYFDPNTLNFSSILHPVVLSPISSAPQHQKMVFAVFGYGNPSVFQAVNEQLAQQRPHRPFEIRLISSDHRGIEDYPWVKAPIAGRLLTREEMERLATDVDVFLILYEPHRYLLSCSGSIAEAISYQKPIFYLKSECVESFNLPQAPIGISCDDVETLVTHMRDYIDHYPQRLEALERMRGHLLQARSRVEMSAQLPRLRAILTWSDD